MNLYKIERDSQTQKINMVTYREREEREINQAFQISRQKLLYIKQIDNKALLYSTENYSQYLLLTYNGKESEKEYIYMYNGITTLCCTQHCKSTMLQLKKIKKVSTLRIQSNGDFYRLNVKGYAALQNISVLLAKFEHTCSVTQNSIFHRYSHQNMYITHQKICIIHTSMFILTLLLQ